LFLLAPGAHRDLHSFPTRRSSDLEGRYIWQPSLAQGQPDTLLGRPIVTSNFMPEIGPGASSLVFGDFSYYWIVDRRGRYMQRLGDRKSTRLNSSHVKISYAVFCLK